MKLRRDYIESLSGRMAQRLVQKKFIQLHADLSLLQSTISNVIIKDLTVEDDLDEEVRRILEDYAQQMRRQNISYHEMFQMVKRKIVKERNLIL
ncbi:hypothetical protein CSB45_08200 [candidate division KSB3 bacterium]|uniref:DUF507 domain-containing protein n=1 Tax=candidate division KSB3 bacterium TaxID=2044937 RepID=A0A2G6E532_9BACT|nr:MAG: hypothetical protein CSB45_08200 [candidate division KSB3 bacterium]PIE29799.1 MAG: hypothetical protein CSA57_07015 [candidate division KSB3 bacterium]